MTTLSELITLQRSHLLSMATVVPRAMKEPFWGSPTVVCRYCAELGVLPRTQAMFQPGSRFLHLAFPSSFSVVRDRMAFCGPCGRRSVTQEEQKWRSFLGAQATSGTQVRQPLSRHRLEVDFCRGEQGEGHEGLWARGYR